MEKHKCFKFQRLGEIFRHPRWIRLKAEAQDCLGCRKRFDELKEFIKKWESSDEEVVEPPDTEFSFNPQESDPRFPGADPIGNPRGRF